MARGNASVPAMEMTKWFDTNYHFIVPELGPDVKFSYASHKAVTEYKEAKSVANSGSLELSPVDGRTLTDFMRTRDAAYYCICNDGLGDTIYQKNIDYACGAGADCTSIMQNGPCFQPNTVENHCNFAVNSYYQRHGQVQGSCSFSNTATVVQDPPPAISECLHPSSPRAVDKPIIHFSLSIKITLATGFVVMVISVLKLFQRYRRSTRVNEGERHQDAANHKNGQGEIENNTVGSVSITFDVEV
ncbi:unnamed protein product [Fraxinus pennsylvanica]|uniref:X8 domain-containing protein n=1 Tax=Fraxinus pennsylvanica TaxID=56036 RepID=A0AAD2A7K2_9LAMI|nr:unnamed protein product [Fraxinus pennsylvanica]